MNKDENLDRIKAKADYIIKIRQFNNEQPVFQLPKYLFVENILVFLEDEDITSLGATTKIFNLMVYSPFAFRVLLATRAIKATSQAIQHQSIYVNQVLQRDLESLNSKDATVQLSALTTFKDYLTDKSKILEEMVSNSQSEIDKFKTDVMIERHQKQMNQETLKATEQNFLVKNEAYKIEKMEQDETVAEINKQYRTMLAKKDADFKAAQEKTEKIKAEKERLKLEIEKIKEEGRKVQEENEKYITVLNKMQDMFSVNFQNQSQSQSQKGFDGSDSNSLYSYSSTKDF